MPSRAQVVAAAEAYKGVRWRHMGRNKAGLDCIGLLIAIGRDLGQEIKDATEYKRTPDTQLFLDMVRTQTMPGAINCIRPGSIILMKQIVFPCHCGIAVIREGKPFMIHAAIKRKQVVEELLLPMWSDIIEVREFEGVY